METKITLGIVVAVVMLLFLTGCSQKEELQSHTDQSSDKPLSKKEFLKQYGGVYVLNKEARDFIKENEKNLI
ncbi:hypothetical protein, partial [Helicobacter sp.]|uniref:hypothetical protein n=1 Tax=Helicobacter sp. TaxID=218 RepID=UPI0025C5E846